MQGLGGGLDGQVCVAILKACANMEDLFEGLFIHGHIVSHGLHLNAFVCNTLIVMYIKCGSLDDAHSVFDKLLEKDVVTWGAMIEGYAQNESHSEVFQLFSQMEQEGLIPDSAVFVSTLKVCHNIVQGKLLHANIVERGLESDLFLSSFLLDMCAKYGGIEDATTLFNRLVFRDVVTWNVLVSAYVQHGLGRGALRIYQQMRQEGVEPSDATFVTMLKACVMEGALDQGELLHAQIIERGIQSELFIGNALIDMYTTCGSIEGGYQLFCKLLKRDVITWTTLIGGYVKNGREYEALHAFKHMSEEPNKVTLLSILKACSGTAALGQGRLIYCRIVEQGLDSDVLFGSTLVDMFTKCGSLADAKLVFNRWPIQDIATWTAMIGGYGQHGYGEQALEVFQMMQHLGVKPDSAAFLCLFAAFGQVGLVDEACHYFILMRDRHGIMPSIKHYNCLVDSLGHSGYLSEAEDLLDTMAFSCNLIGWLSFLGHCQMHGAIMKGRYSFDNIVGLDPKTSACYTFMSNMYASTGMWEDADSIEEMRKSANAWKKPGRAFIEIDDKVHEFIVGEKNHPQVDQIYTKLNGLVVDFKEENDLRHSGAGDVR